MRSINTMTRADLADAIHRRVGLSRPESATIVESIIGLISDALAMGENVKVSGFGTFRLRDKSERIGRNPKTKVEAVVTPRCVVAFRASRFLKERVANRDER